MAGCFQILAAGLCCRCEEGSVLFVGPSGKELIEVGKMIGGIGIWNSRDKSNKVGGGIDEAHLTAHGNGFLQEITLTIAINLDLDGLGLNDIENVLRFAQIVDAGFIAPKVGGEKKRSDIIKFAITGRTLCIGRTIGLATPNNPASAHPSSAYTSCTSAKGDQRYPCDRTERQSSYHMTCLRCEHRYS